MMASRLFTVYYRSLPYHKAVPYAAPVLPYAHPHRKKIKHPETDHHTVGKINPVSGVSACPGTAACVYFYVKACRCIGELPGRCEDESSTC